MYIVIGGSDGLGKALVASIKSINAKVMNISRRANDLADYNVSCDLSTEKGIATAVDEMKNSSEPLEAIIISAGVFSFKDVGDLDAAEYARTFDINTKAPLLLVSPLIEKIKEDETDVIIINSTAGIRSYTHQTLYNASKAALHSFTKDLRAELAETASRVIGIYPGMIDTDLAQKLPEGPLPKSKHAMIDPTVLADYILYTQRLPKSIEVSNIILDRKKHSQSV